jgi:hypothetical protein
MRVFISWSGEPSRSIARRPTAGSRVSFSTSMLGCRTKTSTAVLAGTRRSLSIVSNFDSQWRSKGPQPTSRTRVPQTDPLPDAGGTRGLT